MQISARAFQRVFTCKNQRRYSRERALQSLPALRVQIPQVSCVAPAMLLLLTPNKIPKKTENRDLLSVSGWGPSTAGKDQKERKLKKNNAIKN